MVGRIAGRQAAQSWASRSRLLAVVVGLAAFVPVGLTALDERGALPVIDAHDPGAGLAVVGGSAHRRNGFVVITGAIRNDGSAPARRVEVVAELADREGTPLDRGSALVGSVDIAGGQQSSFRVILDDPGNVARVVVGTRRLRWDSLTPAWRPMPSDR